MKKVAFGIWTIVLLLIPAVPTSAQDGAAIYRENCAGCHNSMSNAPYKGRSVGALASSVIAGKGAMKPRAGKPSLKDADIRAAVTYLLSK